MPDKESKGNLIGGNGNELFNFAISSSLPLLFLALRSGLNTNIYQRVPYIDAPYHWSQAYKILPQNNILLSILQGFLMPDVKKLAPPTFLQYDWEEVQRANQLRQILFQANSLEKTAGLHPLAYKMLGHVLSLVTGKPIEQSLQMINKFAMSSPMLWSMARFFVGGLFGRSSLESDQHTWEILSRYFAGITYNPYTESVVTGIPLNFATKLTRRLHGLAYMDKYGTKGLKRFPYFNVEDLSDILRMSLDYGMRLPYSEVTQEIDINRLIEKTKGMARVIEAGMAIYHTMDKEKVLQNILQLTRSSVSVENIPQLEQLLYRMNTIAKMTNLSVDMIQKISSILSQTYEYIGIPAQYGAKISMGTILMTKISTQGLPGLIQPQYKPEELQQIGGPRQVRFNTQRIITSVLTSAGTREQALDLMYRIQQGEKPEKAVEETIERISKGQRISQERINEIKAWLSQRAEKMGIKKGTPMYDIYMTGELERLKTEGIKLVSKRVSEQPFTEMYKIQRAFLLSLLKEMHIPYSEFKKMPQSQQIEFIATQLVKSHRDIAENIRAGKSIATTLLKNLEIPLEAREKVQTSVELEEETQKLAQRIRVPRTIKQTIYRVLNDLDLNKNVKDILGDIWEGLKVNFGSIAEVMGENFNKLAPSEQRRFLEQVLEIYPGRNLEEKLNLYVQHYQRKFPKTKFGIYLRFLYKRLAGGSFVGYEPLIEKILEHFGEEPELNEEEEEILKGIDREKLAKRFAEEGISIGSIIKELQAQKIFSSNPFVARRQAMHYFNLIMRLMQLYKDSKNYKELEADINSYRRLVKKAQKLTPKEILSKNIIGIPEAESLHREFLNAALIYSYHPEFLEEPSEKYSLTLATNEYPEMTRKILVAFKTKLASDKMTKKEQIEYQKIRDAIRQGKIKLENIKNIPGFIKALKETKLFEKDFETIKSGKEKDKINVAYKWSKFYYHILEDFGIQKDKEKDIFSKMTEEERKAYKKIKEAINKGEIKLETLQDSTSFVKTLLKSNLFEEEVKKIKKSEDSNEAIDIAYKWTKLYEYLLKDFDLQKDKKGEIPRSYKEAYIQLSTLPAKASIKQYFDILEKKGIVKFKQEGGERYIDEEGSLKLLDFLEYIKGKDERLYKHFIGFPFVIRGSQVLLQNVPIQRIQQIKLEDYIQQNKILKDYSSDFLADLFKVKDVKNIDKIKEGNKEYIAKIKKLYNISDETIKKIQEISNEELEKIIKAIEGTKGYIDRQLQNIFVKDIKDENLRRKANQYKEAIGELLQKLITGDKNIQTLFDKSLVRFTELLRLLGISKGELRELLEKEYGGRLTEEQRRRLAELRAKIRAIKILRPDLEIYIKDASELGMYRNVIRDESYFRFGTLLKKIKEEIPKKLTRRDITQINKYFTPQFVNELTKAKNIEERIKIMSRAGYINIHKALRGDTKELKKIATMEHYLNLIRDDYTKFGEEAMSNISKYFIANEEKTLKPLTSYMEKHQILNFRTDLKINKEVYRLIQSKAYQKFIENKFSTLDDFIKVLAKEGIISYKLYQQGEERTVAKVFDILSRLNTLYPVKPASLRNIENIIKHYRGYIRTQQQTRREFKEAREMAKQNRFLKLLPLDEYSEEIENDLLLAEWDDVEKSGILEAYRKGVKETTPKKETLAKLKNIYPDISKKTLQLFLKDIHHAKTLQEIYQIAQDYGLLNLEKLRSADKEEFKRLGFITNIASLILGSEKTTQRKVLVVPDIVTNKKYIFPTTVEIPNPFFKEISGYYKEFKKDEIFSPEVRYIAKRKNEILNLLAKDEGIYEIEGIKTIPEFIKKIESLGYIRPSMLTKYKPERTVLLWFMTLLDKLKLLPKHIKPQFEQIKEIIGLFNKYKITKDKYTDLYKQIKREGTSLRKIENIIEEQIPSISEEDKEKLAKYFYIQETPDLLLYYSELKPQIKRIEENLPVLFTPRIKQKISIIKYGEQILEKLRNVKDKKQQIKKVIDEKTLADIQKITGEDIKELPIEKGIEKIEQWKTNLETEFRKEVKREETFRNVLTLLPKEKQRKYYRGEIKKEKLIPQIEAKLQSLKKKIDKGEIYDIVLKKLFLPSLYKSLKEKIPEEEFRQIKTVEDFLDIAQKKLEPEEYKAVKTTLEKYPKWAKWSEIYYNIMPFKTSEKIFLGQFPVTSTTDLHKILEQKIKTIKTASKDTEFDEEVIKKITEKIKGKYITWTELKPYVKTMGYEPKSEIEQAKTYIRLLQYIAENPDFAYKTRLKARRTLTYLKKIAERKESGVEIEDKAAGTKYIETLGKIQKGSQSYYKMGLIQARKLQFGLTIDKVLQGYRIVEAENLQKKAKIQKTRQQLMNLKYTEGLEIVAREPFKESTWKSIVMNKAVSQRPLTEEEFDVLDLLNKYIRLRKEQYTISGNIEIPKEERIKKIAEINKRMVSLIHSFMDKHPEVPQGTEFLEYLRNKIKEISKTSQGVITLKNIGGQVKELEKVIELSQTTAKIGQISISDKSITKISNELKKSTKELMEKIDDKLKYISGLEEINKNIKQMLDTIENFVETAKSNTDLKLIKTLLENLNKNLNRIDSTLKVAIIKSKPK